MVEGYLKSLKLVTQTPKNKRKTLGDEIPESHRWLEHCKQAQIPYALLKIIIDTSPSLFYWSSPCDFCVEGNASVAVAKLQPFINQHVSLDVPAWWKRHIVSATPATTEHKGKTLYCFNALDKPSFFCKLPLLSPTEERIRVTEYRCKVCHLPKKGHVCLGMQPLPPSSQSSSIPLKTTTRQQPETNTVNQSTSNTATKRDAYSSMFETTKTIQKESRLEKISKRQKFE